MKLTKKQRHKIYKTALSLQKIDLKEWGYEDTDGLCALLSDAFYPVIGKSFFTVYNYFAPSKVFIEFENIRPKNQEDGYWWPQTKYGYEKRRKFLKKFIELTK